MIKLKPIIQHKTYSVAERMILKHIANKAIKRFNEPEISKALNDFIQNLPTISGISMDFTKEINHVNMNFDPIGDKISSKDNFVYACEYLHRRLGRAHIRAATFSKDDYFTYEGVIINSANVELNGIGNFPLSDINYTWKQDNK